MHVELSVETAIAEFSKLVQAGIESWTKAGEILVKLYAADKQVFQKIMASNPAISLDTLLCFLRIGKKEVYPMLLADSSYGAKRLVEMPYDVQVKYAHEPIEVVTEINNGKVVTAKKPVNQLSRSEIQRVFGKRCIHTIEQQAFRLPEKRSARAANQAQTTKPTPEPATRTFVAVLRFKITKDGAFDCEPIKGAVISQTILLSKVGQEWMADITFVKAG